MGYSIKKSEPCADYGKITLEGAFDGINKQTLLENLKTEFKDVKNIATGKIIMAKNEEMQIYIYDENRFVINKLSNEQYGIEILNKIIK